MLKIPVKSTNNMRIDLDRIWVTLRQTLLSIAPEEATCKTRGFQVKNNLIAQRLEKIGYTFLDGYHAAIGTTDNQPLIAHLHTIENEWQGFAYEGAAMGLKLLESLSLGYSQRLQNFLMGAGSPHIYMSYVGIGWALARLPGGVSGYLTKLRQSANYPDPLLGWLAIDGYGFHQGYFYAQKFIEQQVIPKDLSGYAFNVFDQGLGRSLWFVKGADIEEISRTIEAFPTPRQADLWSGIGLAATYAGGVNPDEMLSLKARGQAYLPEIAQGAAFAAKTRIRAGNLTEPTEMACQVLGGMSAPEASKITDLALEGIGSDYHLWRQRIQAYFVQEGVKP